MGNDKGGAGYELLLYECQRQRTDLERRMEEMETRIEKLKRENAGLKSQLETKEHSLRRIGPLGKPLVW